MAAVLALNDGATVSTYSARVGTDAADRDDPPPDEEDEAAATRSSIVTPSASASASRTRARTRRSITPRVGRQQHPARGIDPHDPVPPARRRRRGAPRPQRGERLPQRDSSGTNLVLKQGPGHRFP